MNHLVKNFNNLIKKTIFNVKNKTNINLKISNFNRGFNNLIKKTLFKSWIKTNINFKFSNFNRDFNNLIKKTIFKPRNKTNINFKITNFNKYLITLISLLFFYLFYLSIPVLYSNAWVQRNIENQLLKDFKINFSISSDISYRILPTPHFLIKDSKIFKEDGDRIISFADIKNLKVFVSQKNFFNKEKIIIKNVKIDNANFLLLRNDLKLLKKSINNKFSNKTIEINKSNIFFKDTLSKTVAIIKITKSFFYLDDQNLLNLFKLKGEVFNIPFNFNYNKKFDDLQTREINIIAKKLKFNILDTYINKKNNSVRGKNILSFLNFTINTDYRVEDNMLIFNSSSSKIKNTEVEYDGKLSINPFDLNLNINLNNYESFKLLNINLILNELIKTELLFNNNISVNTSIITTSNLKKSLFQRVKVDFNIINGKINFDKTKLINNKIGLIELGKSNLILENNNLILNTDVMFNIKDSDELFSLLQTNKQFRKPIKNILLNLDYNFLTNKIRFNNFKVDNKEVSDELFRVIDSLNDNNSNNWNKNKRLINRLFENYDG